MLSLDLAVLNLATEVLAVDGSRCPFRPQFHPISTLPPVEPGSILGAASPTRASLIHRLTTASTFESKMREELSLIASNAMTLRGSSLLCGSKALFWPRIARIEQKQSRIFLYPCDPCNPRPKLLEHL